MENHSHFNIDYTIESEPNDLFSAITRACFFLENQEEFKQRVFLKMKDLFVDLEDNSVSAAILDIIGQVLDNVRIIVIDDAEQSILGGGCHPDKCKHRILLQKKDCFFVVLSTSDDNKYYLDNCLQKGFYKYRSFACCKIVFFMMCASTIFMLYSQNDWFRFR